MHSCQTALLSAGRSSLPCFTPCRESRTPQRRAFSKNIPINLKIYLKFSRKHKIMGIFGRIYPRYTRVKWNIQKIYRIYTKVEWTFLKIYLFSTLLGSIVFFQKYTYGTLESNGIFEKYTHPAQEMNGHFQNYT